MQSPSKFVLLAGVLAIAGACAQQPDATDDGEQQALASAEITEIPITTANEAARVDFLAGQELSDVARPQEANELFRAAVEKDPTFAYAYLNIAFTGQTADEFNSNVEKAMEHVAHASNGEKMLIEVGGAFTDADNDMALEISKTLTETYPASPRAWLNLGGVLSGRQENAKAREAFMKALELDPNMYAAHSAIGFDYLFQEPRDFAKAKEHFEDFVALMPEEAKGYEFLGDTYRAMGELETARASYSSALEKDPGLGVAALKKGHINSFLGNFDEARADYDIGIENASTFNKGSYAVYRAFVALHAGAPAEAIAELLAIAEGAGELDVREDQKISIQMFALNQAASIALHHEMFDGLKEILVGLESVRQQNIELVGDPDFTRTQEAIRLWWKARAAAWMGEIDVAKATLEEHKALLEPVRIPTRFQGYHQILGEIALKQGDFGEAITQLEQADPGSIYVKYLLASAQEGAGNAEEAKRLFTEVANFNFNSVGFALVRQDAMAKAGMS
jgi:tetratricopeptide (TPR) repeat protein